MDSSVLKVFHSMVEMELAPGLGSGCSCALEMVHTVLQFVDNIVSLMGNRFDGGILAFGRWHAVFKILFLLEMAFGHIGRDLDAVTHTASLMLMLE